MTDHVVGTWGSDTDAEVFVQVPEDATLTLTQIGEAPDGDVPVARFALFIANVVDMPQLGFGGVSTAPDVNVFTVPVTVVDGDHATDSGAEEADDGERTA